MVVGDTIQKAVIGVTVGATASYCLWEAKEQIKKCYISSKNLNISWKMDGLILASSALGGMFFSFTVPAISLIGSGLMFLEAGYTYNRLRQDYPEAKFSLRSKFYLYGTALLFGAVIVTVPFSPILAGLLMMTLAMSCQLMVRYTYESYLKEEIAALINDKVELQSQRQQVQRELSYTSLELLKLRTGNDPVYKHLNTLREFSANLQEEINSKEPSKERLEAFKELLKAVKTKYTNHLASFKQDGVCVEEFCKSNGLTVTDSNYLSAVQGYLASRLQLREEAQAKIDSVEKSAKAKYHHSVGEHKTNEPVRVFGSLGAGLLGANAAAPVVVSSMNSLPVLLAAPLGLFALAGIVVSAGVGVFAYEASQNKDIEKKYTTAVALAKAEQADSLVVSQEELAVSKIALGYAQQEALSSEYAVAISYLESVIAQEARYIGLQEKKVLLEGKQVQLEQGLAAKESQAKTTMFTAMKTSFEEMIETGRSRISGLYEGTEREVLI